MLEKILTFQNLGAKMLDVKQLDIQQYEIKQTEGGYGKKTVYGKRTQGTG